MYQVYPEFTGRFCLRCKKDAKEGDEVFTLVDGETSHYTLGRRLRLKKTCALFAYKGDGGGCVSRWGP